MAHAEKIHLGDLLVNQGLISLEQQMEALAMQKRSGRKLGRVLLENGFVTEDELSGALAHQLRIPMADPQPSRATHEVSRLLPEALARRFRAVVLGNGGERPILVMADPSDLFAYGEILQNLNCGVELAVANESCITQCIERGYGQAA